ncbi:hypothetical protein RRF57_012844 [Xylaria bambusicola]|uniref:Heterokaryon incompatibility domain-containing protein n=1 Tax=Xylaria bambusicola TaxID=326684 RepID=A0AAN7ZB38_9PEZI
MATSKKGCALYERFVDIVVLNIVKQGNWQESDILCSAAYKFDLFAIDSGSNAACSLTAGLTSTNSLTIGTAPKTIFLDLLQGWTIADNPAVKLILSRPYEQDVKSTRSVKFARDCLQECMENHFRCTPFLTDKTDRESRVKGPKKALETETVDIAHVPSRLIYGGNQPLSLTKIDALCIFQDSNKDKASKLARMATYYSCAKFTIYAAAASRCTEGFLYAREPSLYQFGPVRLRLRDDDGEAGNLYVLKEAEAEVEAEPTVLQA